jgi:adenylate cyclase
MAAYVIPHVMNLGLGVLSFEAMDSFQEVYAPIWRSLPGTILLYGAFLVHFVLTLVALFRRSTMRMPTWEATQIIMGLLMPIALIGHAVSVRVHRGFFGEPITYEAFTHVIFSVSPAFFIWYSILIVVVWTHVMVGLHFWLRSNAVYRRWVPVLRPAAVVVVAVGLVGLWRIAWVIESNPGVPGSLTGPLEYMVGQYDAYFAETERTTDPFGYSFLGLVAAVFIARSVRERLRRRKGVFSVGLPSGRTITSPLGHTVLEALRIARVPHAAICGGRGRCTTCRVSVRIVEAELDPPDEVERRGLARIGASPDVRLACQLRPAGILEIVPLLAANATAREANRRGGVRGREQPVVIMFLDLRASTKLGEDRLPYDVLFILNQFFAEMAAALEQTDGHYAQFSGDGLMALYGIEGGVGKGVRKALEGARVMHHRLARLNEGLKDELSESLRMGIGIHCGDAIVGTMGPPSAPNFSAIGDNVNIAARLESMTKELDCSIIVSASAARSSGLDFGDARTAEVAVRGREEPVAVYCFDDAALLPATEGGRVAAG